MKNPEHPHHVKNQEHPKREKRIKEHHIQTPAHPKRETRIKSIKKKGASVLAQDQQARKQGAKPCTRTLCSHGDSAFCLKPCVLRLCLLLQRRYHSPPHPPQRTTLISCVAAGYAAAALAAAETLPFPPPPHKRTTLSSCVAAGCAAAVLAAAETLKIPGAQRCAVVLLLLLLLLLLLYYYYYYYFTTATTTATTTTTPPPPPAAAAAVYCFPNFSGEELHALLDVRLIREHKEVMQATGESTGTHLQHQSGYTQQMFGNPTTRIGALVYLPDSWRVPALES